MTREQAQAAVAKFGSHQKAATALKTHKNTIYRALHKHAATATGDAEQRKGRTLADFRAAYDKDTIIPARIKKALQALGSGWEYEVEFAKLAGVSLIDMGRYRPQFAEHVVSIGRDTRRAWAGSKATATAMREML